MRVLPLTEQYIPWISEETGIPEELLLDLYTEAQEQHVVQYFVIHTIDRFA